VQARGAVNAETDKKSMGHQELAPFVIEQCAIGLEGIVNRLSIGIFFL
jgi:hypothetical protein